MQDELRRSLFSEIWVRLRHLSGPSEVRQLIRALMYPAGPPGEPRRTGPASAPIHHHAAPGALPRLSGCTISLAGGSDRRMGTGGSGNGGASGCQARGRGARAQPPDGMLTGPAALAPTWPPPRYGRCRAGHRRAAGGVGVEVLARLAVVGDVRPSKIRRRAVSGR